jgi:hypothetical protein
MQVAIEDIGSEDDFLDYENLNCEKNDGRS